MISRDAVRTQSAVQAFDHRRPLEEYGFTTGSAKEIGLARQLVAELVHEADKKCDAYFEKCEAEGQNPYQEHVVVNGRQVKFAADIKLFDAGTLRERIRLAFSATEKSALAQPNEAKLATKVIEGIVALVQAGGYESVGFELHNDSTPTRMVIRDSDYATEAMRRGAMIVNTIDAIGSALASVPQGVSAATLGLPSSATNTQLRKAHNTAVELVELAKQRVVDYFDAALTSGLSPFGGQVEFYASKAAYIGRATKNSRGKKVVNDAATISLLTYADLNPRTRELTGIDAEKFRSHVNTLVIEQLSQTKTLPLAAVIIDRDSIVGHFAKPSDARPFWSRLWPAPKPEPKPIAALPPPAPLKPPQPTSVPAVDQQAVAAKLSAVKATFSLPRG